MELFATDTALARTLSSWKGRLLGFAGFVSKLGAGMFAGGAALLAPLAGLFLATTEHLDNLSEAAERLGTTPDVFDALSKSAKMAGIQTETLETSVSRMQAVLSDAAHGGMETSAALASIGIDAKKLIDLPLDDQLAAIADGISAVGNAADRTAVARKIFGKGGAGMLPLLNGGGAGVRAAMDQFRDPALNEAAKNAGRLADMFDLVKMTIKSTAASVVFGFLDMVGPIETVAIAIVKAAKEARGFIRENRAIIVTVAGVAAAVMAGGVAFIGIGLTLAALVTAVGGFVAAFGLMYTIVVGGLSLLATKAGIAAVAFLLMGGTLSSIWGHGSDGQKAIAQLRSGLGELVQTARSAAQGISDAFAGGDLALAGQIAFTALKLEFTKVIGFWQDRWNAFKGFFVDGWHDAIKLLKLAWTDLDEWFSDLFLGIITHLNDAFGSGIKKMLNGIADAIEKADIVGLFGDTVKELRNVGDAFGSSTFSDELKRERAASKKEHEEKRRQIEKEAAAAQEARDKARAGDKAAIDEKIGRLEKELAALNELAAEEAWQQALWDAAQPDPKKPMPGLEAMQSFAGSAKGGFGGPLAAQFSAGDSIAGKQLDTLHDIRDGIDGLPGKFGKQLEMK